MRSCDDGNRPLAQLWITPKAVKGGASAIEGQGVHAVEAIAGGEVVGRRSPVIRAGRSQELAGQAERGTGL